jgi:ribosomal protein S18 acetylase RimI-like enzyme
MGIANSILRFTDYYRRQGFINTVRRAGLALHRMVFASRTVVFYCDLTDRATSDVVTSSPLTINRRTSEAELSPQDLLSMTNFWNPKQARRNIRERFEKGASLWLVSSDGDLAGYGWSLQGRTVEPYYFPLGKDDIHLFDFHVFPQYRGRGINPLLVTHILHNLAANRRGRAFIEAAEWNEAQLSSLRKTPFGHLGMARSFTLFGHTFVSWKGNIALQQTVEDLERKDVPAAAGRPPGE